MEGKEGNDGGRGKEREEKGRGKEKRERGRGKEGGRQRYRNGVRQGSGEGEKKRREVGR